MKKLKKRVGVACTAVLGAALVSFVLAGGAQAELVGEFKKFEQCPYETEGVDRCLYSVTTGGEVVLGSKTVPIVNDVVLQGAYSEPNPEDEGFAKFFAAKNGMTLSKTPQPVPGGLAGLINCKEIKDFLLRISCEITFENGLTGLNSTLELAQGAKGIKVNELNLALGEGVALKMALKVHLENPFLGSNCYVGSEGSPIVWNLRTDTTEPPEPNKPITGDPGEIEFLEEGLILEIGGAVLVDNAWAAPKANGCGGIFSFIIDPIVNASAGLPSAAGHNTAILENDILETTAAAVKFVDENDGLP